MARDCTLAWWVWWLPTCAQVDVSQHNTMALVPKLAFSPVARYVPLSDRVMQVIGCLKLRIKKFNFSVKIY